MNSVQFNYLINKFLIFKHKLTLYKMQTTVSIYIEYIYIYVYIYILGEY